MRRIVLAALAAASLSLGGGVAEAATGSGTIAFNFTGFSGPYGASSIANLSDPSAWLLSGTVNGVAPTPNGVTSPGGSGFVYVGGTAPLSGASVDMVYSNAPGALDNIISFTPDAGFDTVTTGQAFRIGTLSFTNGQWVGGSGDPATNYPVTLGFTLTTTSASTPAFNQVVNDSFTVVTNQASGDCATAQGQQDEADFIYVTGAPILGSMRVFDQSCKPASATNSGTIELWMSFGSLDYVALRNPGGSAFFESSTGVGAIGGGVPEPAAWTLMILGFSLTGATLRRRRERSAIA